MRKVKKMFIVFLFVIFQNNLFASQQNDGRQRAMSLDSGLEFLQKKPIQDDETTSNHFEPEIVDNQTEFRYPHLDLGFQLAGRNDCQDFMRSKIIGKDLQTKVKDGLVNSISALDYAMESANRVIVSSHKDYFRNYVLNSLDKNVDTADCDDQIIDYIQTYQHVMPGFEQSIYSWPIFVQGFTAINKDFKKNIQTSIAEQLNNQDIQAGYIFDKDGVVRPEFKIALIAAKKIIVDQTIDEFFSEIDAVVDEKTKFSEITNQQFKYVWKYRHVDFMHQKILSELADDDCYWLKYIMHSNDHQAAKFLIDLYGIDTHVVSGETLLHCAVKLKANKIVDSLIKYKADINKVAYDSHSKFSYTPLIAAVKNLNCACVKLLLDADADTRYVDSEGKKAVDYIKIMRPQRVIRLTQFYESEQICHLFRKAEQQKVLQDLIHVPSQHELETISILQEGFNLFGIDYQLFMQQQLGERHPDELVWIDGPGHFQFESTVLTEAFNTAGVKFEIVMKKRVDFNYFRNAIQNNRDILQDAEIQFLLKYRHRYPFCDNYLKGCFKMILKDCPLLHEAIGQGAGNVVKALLVMGYDPNCLDWNGRTPLQNLALLDFKLEDLAKARERYTVIAKILLDAGADMDEKGRAVHSAFEIAEQSVDQALFLLFKQMRGQQQDQSDSDVPYKKMKFTKE